MLKAPWIAVSSLVIVGTGIARFQSPSEPLLSHTFKDSIASWTGIGPSAKVSLSHEAPVVVPDAGALKFDYRIDKGSFNALYLPVPGDKLATAKSLRFRVHADFGTVVAVMMQEEEGGRYVAMVHAPKGEWQTVELSTADFVLSTDPGDPADSNQKLDMDRVNGIVIGDSSQFFVQFDDPKTFGLFDVPKGAHALYIDSFAIGADTVAPSASSVGDNVRIDSFSHPQIGWLGLGGPRLSRTSDKPLTSNGMKIDYRQSPGKPMLVMKGMRPWILNQSKSLSFDIASKQMAKLVVQVEETDGGKYNILFEVPGGSELKHFDFPFSEFKPSEDSKDPNGKLDLAKIKSLLFIDTYGFTSSVEQDNTLWIGNLTGLAGK